MEFLWASRYRNYWFLIPLFVIALAYEITYAYVVVRQEWRLTQLVAAPFDVEPSKDGGAIVSVSDSLAKEGLHKGDHVLDVDGHRIVGERDFYEEAAKHKPNDRVLLTVEPKGGGASRTLVVKLGARSEHVDALDWVLTAVLLSMALLCVLTGIYAAAVLPNDKRALIVFGLLFAVSQIVHSAGWYEFPRPLWFWAEFIPLLGAMNLGLFLALFALYFPERFGWDIRRPLLKWLVIVPVAVLNILTALYRALCYFDFRILHTFGAGILTNSIINAATISSVMITLFFLAILSKLKTATTTDAEAAVCASCWLAPL